MGKQRKNKEPMVAIVRLSGNDNRHLFEQTVQQLNDRIAKHGSLGMEMGVPRLHDGAGVQERLDRYRHVDDSRRCANLRRLWIDENGDIVGEIETAGPMAGLIEASIKRDKVSSLRFGMRAMVKNNNLAEVLTYDLIDYG